MCKILKISVKSKDNVSPDHLKVSEELNTLQIHYKSEVLKKTTALFNPENQKHNKSESQDQKLKDSIKNLHEKRKKLFCGYSNFRENAIQGKKKISEIVKKDQTSPHIHEKKSMPLQIDLELQNIGPVIGEPFCQMKNNKELLKKFPNLSYQTVDDEQLTTIGKELNQYIPDIDALLMPQYLEKINIDTLSGIGPKEWKNIVYQQASQYIQDNSFEELINKKDWDVIRTTPLEDEEAHDKPKCHIKLHLNFKDIQNKAKHDLISKLISQKLAMTTVIISAYFKIPEIKIAHYAMTQELIKHDKKHNTEQASKSVTLYLSKTNTQNLEQIVNAFTYMSSMINKNFLLSDNKKVPVGDAIIPNTKSLSITIPYQKKTFYKNQTKWVYVNGYERENVINNENLYNDIIKHCKARKDIDYFE